jgi:hypothetical protein
MQERDKQGSGMMESDRTARGMKGHDMRAHDSLRHRILSFLLSLSLPLYSPPFQGVSQATRSRATSLSLKF